MLHAKGKWASPKQTAKRVEVLPFSLSAWCSSYRKSVPYWDPELQHWAPGMPHQGLGRAAADSCAVCTLQKMRGQGGKRGLEFCTKPGLRWCGHRFLISTEVPDALAVTLGLGRKGERRRGEKINSLRSLSASHFWDICFGVSAQRPGGAGSSWCVSPGLTSSQL